MKIKFLGAAKTVTGSCYLVDCDDFRFLVDCGMFQGQDVGALNYIDFDFDPAQIDFAILTHAHIDHSGLLPKLVKKGFKGKVFATTPTIPIVEALLLDAARIQGYENRLHNTDPLYDERDVEELMSLLRPVEFDSNFAPLSSYGDLEVQFIRAGHILGAASVFIRHKDKSILFSGDIGRSVDSLVEGFDTSRLSALNPDFVVMESLYGGNHHQERRLAVDELLSTINKTLLRNASVVIPCFSLHRSQEFIEIFDLAFMNSIIKNNVQIFFDGRLTNSITDLYRKYENYLNQERKTYYSEVGFANNDTSGSFYSKNIVFSRSSKKSLKIGGKKNSVFVAGSGMADGGRVLRHLKLHIENPSDSVIFVGYQAEGTLGRSLVDGEKSIMIDGDRYDVRAQIELISGFSAHADNSDLLSWLGAISKNKLSKVFLTHSDVDRSENFKKQIEKDMVDVYIPGIGDEFVL